MYTELDPFEAVLFDMDGVLLDTEPLYTEAYNRILSEYGQHLDAATKREIMGRPAPLSAAHVLTKLGIPLSPEEFLARRRPILEALVADAPPVKGAQELVTELAKRGKKLAVATSTGRELFYKKTHKFPWFFHFHAVVCADDPGVKSPKPAPDIFLRAAELLGAMPESCAIFEDSPSGIQAAMATGGRVFGLVEDDELALPLEPHRRLRSYGDLK